MKLYSIGQASAMISIPVRTLRYYESIGLCKPSLIDEESGYRYYSLDDIFRLDLIRCLGRQIGMPLKTIREFLRESEKPQALKAYLREQSGQLDDQIRELELRRDFLDEKLAAIERREKTPSLVPYIEQLPERAIYARREQAETVGDAMLLVRKTAAQALDGCRPNLYLIFDVFNDRFSSPGMHSFLVGIDGRAGGQSLSLMPLEAGSYLSIDYPNRDDTRERAVSLLRAYMEENGLRQRGPMVNIGSLIDTASAFSRDYFLKTQIQVLPQ